MPSTQIIFSFLSKCPPQIGEKGVNLSGGQKQRVRFYFLAKCLHFHYFPLPLDQRRSRPLF